MTEQETINQNLQRQIDAQTARIDTVLAKVDTFIGEMRDRDNRRAAELVEIRQRQDADRKALENKIDRLGDKIQNMAIAAVVGFGAITVAIGDLIVATLRK